MKSFPKLPQGRTTRWSGLTRDLGCVAKAPYRGHFIRKPIELVKGQTLAVT